MSDITSCKGRTNRGSKVEHCSSSNQRFLVVILDVDVDYMHRSIELAAAIEQVLSVRLGLISRAEGSTLTIANSIITPLLTSNNDISDLLALLPSFRCKFDLPIAVEHLQQTASRVSKAGMSLHLRIESSPDAYNLGSLAFNSS